MSKTQNPISTVFAAQKATLEQTRNFVNNTIELQRTTTEALVESIDAQEDFEHQNQAVAKQIIDTYFDTLESLFPGDTAEFDSAREDTLETLEQYTEFQAEIRDVSLDALKESIEVYDTIADSYREGTDSAFDAFLTVHEHAERQVQDAVEIDITEE